MSNEPVIGKIDELKFVEATDYSPGPVTLEEFNAMETKLYNALIAFRYKGATANAIVLSNRQWCALRKFSGREHIYPTGNPNFRGVKIIVDGRGDHPNTPLVGLIEF